jgi:hypothetical protein
MATQQLLMSDAVDRSIARLDFQPLAGTKVFFDDRYVKNIQGLGFVNAEYIVSALRQQMFAAGCQLQETAAAADYVVEARVGALGTDGHEITYGLPPNKTISSAASVLPNVPDLPALPEISVGKRNDQMSAAKIAVFAYQRESREPVWQSGTSVALSEAKNVWVLGAGPFQRGSIYQGTRFAGERLRLPLLQKERAPVDEASDIAFSKQQIFTRVPTLLAAPSVATAAVTDEGHTPTSGTAVQPANHEQPAPAPEPAAQPSAAAPPQPQEKQDLASHN